MGMTIDTVDKWLKIQRQNLINFPEIAHDKKIESLDTAISYLEDYQQLMNKYQKIEEIYKNWCYPTYFNATDAMNKLGEVLKDGM